jgi:hypothetical protein
MKLNPQFFIYLKKKRELNIIFIHLHLLNILIHQLQVSSIMSHVIVLELSFPL